MTRIVDYKTGTVSDYIKSISDLFTDDRKKDADGWLQTLLYCEAYLAENAGTNVRPSIYKIKKLNNTVFNDHLRVRTEPKTEMLIEDYESVREEFLTGLKLLISTIFGRDEPFVKTTDIRGKCKWCPYRILCMR